MKHKSVILCSLLLLLASCQHYVSYTDTIVLNDHATFYAAEGRGKPVILLHGNGGSHCDLETLQRQVAQAGYLVYALDSRGQGANQPLDEYHYADMAEDVYAFLQAKGIQQPAVYGWSDGGIVALELESRHPGTCALIVTSGANVTADNALVPDVSANIFGDMSDIDSLPPLLRMMCLEPNMTADDLQKIQVPVLVCAGEHDLILPEHTAFIAESLPRGEQRIVPGEDHGSYIWHNPLMGDILLQYLQKNKY